MFEALIIKPIFNLLVAIYAFLPGHNFGLAIIIFTVVVRFLMWPMVKKQMHHTKAMRELQPEIKRIKKAAKGNRQQESMMMMALYKEREIKPFAMIGGLVVQLIVLIGLYQGLIRLIDDPRAIIDNAYGFLQNTAWLQTLAADISKFDATLFGAVDLTRAAVSEAGLYLPALVLVLGSAFSQYFQSKQLMPTDQNARKLRDILKDAKNGKQADQSELNAAMGRSTKYFFPVLIFVFTVGLASALSLYWLVSGVVAYAQQRYILGKDVEEMSASVKTTNDKGVIEGEVVSSGSKKSTAKKSSKKKKRRKR